MATENYARESLPSRRSVLRSLGAIGAGALATGASGSAVQPAAASGTDPVDAERPVWIRQDAARNTGDYFWDNYPGQHNNHVIHTNASLWYYGATWVREADASGDEPYWKHKFLVTADGWNAVQFDGSYRPGEIAKAEMFAERRFGNANIDPTADDAQIGWAKPSNLEAELADEFDLDDLAEHVAAADASVDAVDFLDEYRAYDDDLQFYEQQADLQDAIDATALFVGLAFPLIGASYKGYRIFESASEMEKVENKIDGFERGGEIEPGDRGFGGVQFARFDAHLPAGESDRISVSARFGDHIRGFLEPNWLHAAVEWEVKLSAMPRPDHACVDDRDHWRDGANVLGVNHVGDDRDLLERIDPPSPQIQCPLDGETYPADEPVEFVAANDDALETMWYIHEHSKESCNDLTEGEIAGGVDDELHEGTWDVYLLQRNDAGLTATDSVTIEVERGADYPDGDCSGSDGQGSDDQDDSSDEDSSGCQYLKANYPILYQQYC